MKDFFLKHSKAFEPSDAIELLCDKMYEVKELVFQGDERHLRELEKLSEMIDDYVRYSKGQKFNPKEYEQQESQSYGPSNEMEEIERIPYRSERQIGYHFPIYPGPFPFYSPLDRGGRGGGGGGGGSSNRGGGGGGRGR